MNEIWKDIRNYEGLYQVSNLGNVKSLDRIIKHSIYGNKICKGKLLTQNINHRGYHRVTLFTENKRNRVAVHRLVADAFIENTESLPQINHKDENPHNNTVDNLEWCTNSYNVNYGTRTERAVSHMRKPVIQFGKDGNFIARYISCAEAGKQSNIQWRDISSVCLGKRKYAGGYRWQYE